MERDPRLLAAIEDLRALEVAGQAARSDFKAAIKRDDDDAVTLAMKAIYRLKPEWVAQLRVVFDLADELGLDDEFPNPARQEVADFHYCPFFDEWVQGVTVGP